MYFIICELLRFQNVVSVAKNANLNNCSKTTHYAQKYLLNCFSLSIVLFFKNSSSKAFRLLFIFVHVSTGHAHFSTDEICISCEPDGLTSVFFSCETANSKHG